MQAFPQRGSLPGHATGTAADQLPLLNLTINLKQWRILHAVVSCGSFSNAATALGMSQPAVSYTIAKMEEQLGVTLLRQEGRRARLTEEGSALLERAGVLLRDAFALEEYVHSLRQGLGPQFRLAVDRDFPTRSLFSKLRTFTVQGRPARVQLIEVGTQSVVDMLRRRSVDLAIVDHVPAGFSGEPFAHSEYVLVAHPQHRLLKLGRPLTQADLDREVQVVVLSESDRAHAEPGLMALAPQWRVSNFDTAETALLDGVGYGCMPRHRIEGLLRSGRLQSLPVDHSLARKATYYLVHPRPPASGSQVQRLAQLLAEDH